MLLQLYCCQLQHIHHAYINIAIYVIGGQRWFDILRITWSMTRYQITLRLWHCVLWRAGWLLTNQGQLRWIIDWIIQWRRHKNHQWCQLIDLWVTFLANEAPVITSVATTNTLWTWHDECNMSMWWCCVHVILFVDGQQKVRDIFLRNNCSHVCVLVPGIKWVTNFLTQYNQN